MFSLQSLRLLANNRLKSLPDMTDFYKATLFVLLPSLIHSPSHFVLNNSTVDGNCFTCEYAQERLPEPYSSSWSCNESSMNGEQCNSLFSIITFPYSFNILFVLIEFELTVHEWLSSLSIVFVVGLGSLIYFALVFVFLFQYSSHSIHCLYRVLSYL